MPSYLTITEAALSLLRATVDRAGVSEPVVTLATDVSQISQSVQGLDFGSGKVPWESLSQPLSAINEMLARPEIPVEAFVVPSSDVPEENVSLISGIHVNVDAAPYLALIGVLVLDARCGQLILRIGRTDTLEPESGLQRDEPGNP